MPHQNRFGARQSYRQFSDLETLPDPKPRQQVSFKNILLATVGALGAFYGGATAQWTSARVSDWMSRPITELRQTSPALDTTVNGINAIDRFRKNIPVLRSLEESYVVIFRFEAFLLALTALLGIRRKKISPSELFAELNRRGLTGKGIKVAVIDSGVLAVGAIRKNNLTVYHAEDFTTPIKPFETLGHGTSVTHIIAEANPEAEISMMPCFTDSENKRMFQNAQQIIREIADSPDVLTLGFFRQRMLGPVIKNIAQGIRAAADQGVTVVNISLGLEQASSKLFTTLSILLKLSIALSKIKGYVPGAGTEASAINAQKLKNLLEGQQKLQALREKDKSEDPLNDEIKGPYQPYYDALDYAYEKGMAVVVSSGNQSGHRAKSKTALGNTDPLCIDHPALISVASTNSDGEISSFTSEYNHEIHPFVAANGSGELSTVGARKSSLLLKILSPLGGIIARQKTNPQGTSFAAPNFTALYVKMKQLDPTLTIAEIKTLIAAAANQAEFSPKDLETIKAEVTNRLSRHHVRPQSDRKIELKEFLSQFFAVTSAAIGLRPGPQKVSLADGEIEAVKESDDVISVSFTDSKKPEEKIKVELHGVLKIKAENPDDLLETLGKAGLAHYLLVEHPQKSEPTEQDIQTEIGLEIQRRVGHGTIVGKHHKIIYLTEANAMKKASP